MNESEKKIDYRALLVKFMAAVAYSEATAYTHLARPGLYGLTQEEVDELHKLDQEAEELG